MASLDWALTALQSDDAAVAAHALLCVWQRVHCQQLAAVYDQFTALSPRAWRRLGLLLFAEDVVSVKAVVGVAMALTSANEHDHHDDDARRAVQQRMWRSDWRQFLVDKLTDCHARATGDADIALRLVVVLRAVFLEALRCGMATPKDQVRTIDMLVELASSPLDSVACVALEWMRALLGGLSPDQALDNDVRAYLEASRVYSDLLAWLHVSLETPISSTNQPRSSYSHNLRNKRQQLTLQLLVEAARASVDVVRTIASPQSDQLVDLVLRMAERGQPAHRGSEDNYEPLAQAVQLLAVILQHDLPVAAEMASAIRLGGALITVTWLLGHASCRVREASYDVIAAVQRLSAARDLARALVEQGCVLLCYTLLADEAADYDEDDDSPAPCRALLWWVLSLAESQDDQFLLSMALSARRSTNAKLQRNVLLALVLLSHSSDSVHAVLFDGETLTDVVRTALHASGEDTRLATALIATALLGSDTHSTLKRDPAVATMSLRAVNVETPERTAHDTLPNSVTFVCKGGERVVANDTVALSTHCKSLARLLLCPSASQAAPTIDLHDHEATVVTLLIRLVPLSAHHAARELERTETVDSRLLPQLLRLAKTVECTKCWHAASLAISRSLSGATWPEALAVAVEVRHPALLLRALRVALASDGRVAPAIDPGVVPPTEVTAHTSLNNAAITAWKELLTCKHG